MNKLNLLGDLPSLPPVSLSFHKTVVNGNGGQAAHGKALPGSGFTSDEDIRAFSEALRKDARPRAVERALDAETLESVLRAIPDMAGSLSGARARARRVSRHLKRIAAAEKLIAKQAAAMYATFSREFEAELAQVSRGRVQQRRSGIWKPR
ncbi:plasmid transfer protein TraA [Streptomyces sp. NBC_00237]|uniref:plasmid transfer protein TraA n=1 Tax=Streptomyces sp. NBC_00237 TaxID=2975687 RepID=UPI002255CBFA|nr:plasmid transfer protein TraA [Streptomyces sp. NBC_00237]MCX5202459.1 plasmid transfer protein TraA [Streptomyces sp. NBC_00237]